MLSQFIDSSSIHQGDLVFILHKRPLKTGWWRLLRTNQYEGGVDMILEKPMHKDYDPHHPSIRDTRIQEGVCAMTRSTFVEGVKNKEYEILYLAKGIACALIVQNNYMPTSSMIEYNRKDFITTPKGNQLFSLYREEQSELKDIARNLIR